MYACIYILYAYTCTIILPVLYDYEIMSLTLRKEYTLQIFENKVFRKLFRSKVGRPINFGY